MTGLPWFLEILMFYILFKFILKRFVKRHFIYFKKKRKGKKAEKKAEKHLRSVSKRGDLVVKNFFVKEGGGGEIDLFLLKGESAFVVEVKNIYGKVYGDAKERYWKYGDTEFYNPVKQNEGHIKKLEMFFFRKNIKVKNFYNVVYMPFKNKRDIKVFRSTLPENAVLLTSKKDLKKYIDSKKTNKTINNKSVKQLIISSKKKNKRAAKQYIKKIKRKYA